MLLDSGNLLFKANSTPPSAQEVIAARGIADIYSYIGYDAVAVGPYDLQAGIAFLKETEASGFPWVSANLVDGSGAPVCQPYRKITRNGFTVAVIGITGALAPLHETARIADWGTVLPALLKTLSPTSDLIVVLSSLDDSDNRLLLAQHPEINILLGADRRFGNVHPRVVNATLTSQVLSQGKYIGRLDLDWQKDRSWFQDINQEMAVLKRQLAKIDRRIQRAEILQRSSGSENSIAQMHQQKEVVNQRLAALAGQQKTAEDGASANTFSGSFVALSGDRPESREVNAMLEKLQEEIARSYVANPETDGVSASCGE